MDGFSCDKEAWRRGVTRQGRRRPCATGNAQVEEGNAEGRGEMGVVAGVCGGGRPMTRAQTAAQDLLASTNGIGRLEACPTG